MNTPKPDRTIDQLFEEFLADQEARLGLKTYDKYKGIIQLYRSYLESCWPDHSGKEADAIAKARGTCCGTFGEDGPSVAVGRCLEHLAVSKVLRQVLRQPLRASRQCPKPC